MSAQPEVKVGTVHDSLDMRQYRIEQLPVRQRTAFEQQLARAGLVLAPLIFLLFAFVIELPYLQGVNPDSIVSAAAKSELAAKGA
ncbi:MAG: hypothetical protein KIS79_11960, partial [Burkholderiales bacterium]|nr:hypothetical protein [Burkholderiales bacterium]